MREDVGPARNPLLKRRKNAQQDTKTQWSLLVYFDSAAKGVLEKLGRFSYTFAEITDGMSSERKSRDAEINSNQHYTPFLYKIKPISRFFMNVSCL